VINTMQLYGTAYSIYSCFTITTYCVFDAKDPRGHVQESL
jgi:hypothetical protein